MTSGMIRGSCNDLNRFKVYPRRGWKFIFIVNIEATVVTAFPATILMTLHGHLSHLRIWCVVVHVACSSVVKSLCNTLTNALPDNSEFSQSSH